MIGTTLAHFKITAKLGEGGMGEVYLAEDTKLGREVAIKVLPEAVASDPERLARFEREAKVLASLNHPNIAAIYSFESAERAGASPAPTNADADVGEGLAPSRDAESPGPRTQAPGPSIHFLVMELVDGDDLAERIIRGPIPVGEALPIALQIAEALEAAHERGIVHRDLKPANIKVTADGQVKVLDFGLAKALDPTTGTGSGFLSPGSDSLSMSPTLTANMTGVGVILGTAAYMSPEQAKGKTVDKRADIWSYGVILWEMLTGQRLFGQEHTLSEVIAAVLTREPDLNTLPAGTPPTIRNLLSRCLVKEPHDRLRDIGEGRLAIRSAIDGDDLGIADSVQVEHRTSRHVTTVLAAALAGILVGVLLLWLLRPAPEKPVVKLEVPTENLRGQRVLHPLISPNGKRVLVPNDRGLSVRSLDEMSSRPIPDSIGARYPCWSPDSQSVGFVVGNVLQKVSMGGDPTPVATLPASVGGSGGMVWTSSGHFLVAGGDKSGIFQVSVHGGEFREILALDEGQDVDFHEISLLPNGEDVAFVVHREDPASQVRLVDTLAVFATGERKDVHSWLPSASSDGLLLLVHGLDLPLFEIVEVDRQGALIRTIGQIEGDGEAPYLSPDGTRLTLTAVEAGNWDIWIYDLERGTDSRFTFESTFDVSASWSATGDEILYSTADTRQLKIKPVDGSEEAKTVGEGLDPGWIPDGSGLIFQHFSDDTKSWNISYKLLDENEAVPLLATPANEISPRISPDGRYFLYVSDETGASEVFARPFPAGDGKWQVSSAGGTQPKWSRDGREIFYLERDTLLAVDVVDVEPLALGRPVKAMATKMSRPMPLSSEFATYEPGLEGQSIFLVRPAENGTSPNRLMLIQNWSAEFEGSR